VDFAWGDIQADVAERLDAAESLADAMDLN
jgi:hypothetical protein